MIEWMTDPRPHVHHKLMKQYGDDARCTHQPWLYWQYSNNGSNWYDCTVPIMWEQGVQYRRVTREVSGPAPTPLTTSPSPGTRVYVSECRVGQHDVPCIIWPETPGKFHLSLLESRLLHLTAMDAAKYSTHLTNLCLVASIEGLST